MDNVSLFVEIVRAGGVGQMLIAMALVVVAMQVHGLKAAVTEVRETIGEQVLPQLNENTSEITGLKATVRAIEKKLDHDHRLY